MKKRKLDRIIDFSMSMNPYNLYVAVPLHMPKNQIIKKVTEYLRKLNFKDNQRFGYYRIRRGKIQRYNLYAFDLVGHKGMNWKKDIYDITTRYSSRILPIEFVGKGEKIQRHKVIKYKRIGYKKFEVIKEKEVKKAVDKLINQFLEARENEDIKI